MSIPVNKPLSLKFRFSILVLIGYVSVCMAQTQEEAPDLPVRTYYVWASELPELSFDIGETKTIPSPNPEKFISLTIPTYKGLPRLGYLVTLNQIKKTDIVEYNRTANRRRAIPRWQSQNLGVYVNLLVLNMMKGQVVPSELLDRYVFNRNDDTYVHNGQIGPIYYTFQPRMCIEGLAAGTLTPERYAHFFCPKEIGNCRALSLQRGGVRWAGNSNEFKARKAYSEYLEQDLPQLLEWSRNLTNEVYFSFMAILSSYDFERGGYPITLNLPRNVAQDSGTAMAFWPEGEEDKSWNPGNNEPIFVKLDADKAEQIDLKLAATGQTSLKFLIGVVKGKIYGLSRASRNSGHTMHYGAKTGVVYDLTGKTIEFYLDETLREKVLEIPSKF